MTSSWLVRCTGYGEAAGHTIYTIVAQDETSNESYETQHRFSEFIELHAALVPILSPALPAAFPISKSMFGGESVKKERVSKLQDYLQKVINLVCPEASEASKLPPPLRSFLGLPPTAGLERQAPNAFPPYASSLDNCCGAEQPSSTHGSAASSAAAAFGVPSEEELAAGVLAAPPPDAQPTPKAAPAPRPVRKTTPSQPPSSFATSSMAGALPQASPGAVAQFHQFTVARPSDTNEAMREAIKSGDTSACLDLLSSNADPNYRDRQGNSPLHMACMFGRSEVVGALLEAGADQSQENGAGELPSRLASVSIRMKMEHYKQNGVFD